MPVKKSSFDISKYQIQATTKEITVKIEETKDEFKLTVKPLSWSKRNQLISKSLQFTTEGQSSFNGDFYVRECLKEMIVEAPWGRTTESFLMTIDARLGGALESLVPKAFNDEGGSTETIKKE